MKDNLIATYKEKEWYLEHYYLLDDFGVKRNHMQIYRIDDKGKKIIYPFHAPSIQKYNFNNYFDCDDTSKLEDSEYAKILKEVVESIKTK